MPRIKSGETDRQFANRTVREFLKLQKKKKRKLIPGIGVSKNLKPISIGRSRSVDQKLFKRASLLQALKKK